jgi:hypothetical protein
VFVKHKNIIKNGLGMDTIQLNIERNQFVGLLQTLNRSDQLAIYKVLKKSLFSDIMQNIPTTGELSMKEVTEIVNEVRQEMYERGEQYL